MLLLPGSGQGWPRSPPSAGASSAAAAGGARARAAVPCQGASRQVPTAGAKAREKGGTRQGERQHLLPLEPPRCLVWRFGGLEVSGARCTRRDWGAAVPGGKGLWQGGRGAPNRQPNSPWGDSASPPQQLCAGTAVPGGRRVPTRRGVMPMLALPTHPPRHSFAPCPI